MKTPKFYMYRTDKRVNGEIILGERKFLQHNHRIIAAIVGGQKYINKDYTYSFGRSEIVAINKFFNTSYDTTIKGIAAGRIIVEDLNE